MVASLTLKPKVDVIVQENDVEAAAWQKRRAKIIIYTHRHIWMCV